MPAPSSFICLLCGLACKSTSGLSRHIASKHPSVTEEKSGTFRLYHSQLNGTCHFIYLFSCWPLTYYPKARPCNKDGSFLTDPNAKQVPEASTKADWGPFEDRLAFEWAHEYYVELKASKKRIAKGLELWRAALLKGDASTDVPWKSAEEMYNTIDSIQEGDNPWLTYEFCYTGPRPAGIVPKWMDATYELNVRNILVLLEEMLANRDFDGHFDTRPFREYDSDGKRCWSNFMSGDWAADEAVRLLFIMFI